MVIDMIAVSDMIAESDMSDRGTTAAGVSDSVTAADPHGADIGTTTVGLAFGTRAGEVSSMFDTMAHEATTTMEASVMTIGSIQPRPGDQ
jgi:hypothetical protein